MPTLYITQGLQGSGKSTFAEKAVAEQKGKLVEVNRDNIRREQEDYYPSKYNKAFEKRIKEIRDTRIMTALREGKDVICSDTNLAESTLNQLNEIATRCGAEIQMLSQFLDVPFAECVKRDLAREHRVGKDVLLRTFHEMIVPSYEESLKMRDLTLPKAIMVDLDGTLAHMDGKRHPFEANYGVDRIDEAMLTVINAMKIIGYRVILMSGRECTPDGYHQTLDWLSQHGVPYDKLYMRKEKDSRQDSIVKQELYETYVKPKYNVEMVFDDRPQVLRTWALLGLKVFNCGGGYEF